MYIIIHIYIIVYIIIYTHYFTGGQRRLGRMRVGAACLSHKDSQPQLDLSASRAIMRIRMHYILCLGTRSMAEGLDWWVVLSKASRCASAGIQSPFV